MHAMHSWYHPKHRTFTPGQRMPVSVTLKYRDGVYATDSDSSLAGKTETILSQLVSRIVGIVWPSGIHDCFRVL